MLQKLYEQIDSKVLTADVRESLEREFAAAVESKASEIAESRIEEIEAELQEQQQLRLMQLDEDAAEYKREIAEQYSERVEDAEQGVDDHKALLNEKAQEYVDARLADINKTIEDYATRCADEIIKESREVLKNTNKELKASAMYEALHTFAKLAGRNLALDIDKTAARNNRDYNARITKLVAENRELNDRIRALENNLIFEQVTSDMSMYQRERIRMSVAGLIDTADPAELRTNLLNIKESYDSEPELDFEKPSSDRGDLSSLLYKNIN